MLDINHYTDLNLKYNPFSYLSDEELFEVTIERVNLEYLATEIKSNDSCLIEFYGKKGRGKSTHVQLLYYKYFQDAIFYKLKKAKQYYIAPTPNILIIDSFQLLSLKNRLELLKHQKKLIITAHYSHSYFSLKRVFQKKICFSKLSLDADFLETIVTSRVQLASIDVEKKIPKFKKPFLKYLLNKHKNDLRGIQLDLYQQFLKLNQNVYEL